MVIRRWGLWESLDEVMRVGPLMIGVCVCVCVCARARACTHSVIQSCPTLCDTVDCSPPGSSVRGIFQARILEWVSISFSRGSS